ncbi:MAG: hypothetical protein DWI55_08150 [Chloroflexi bacterium]|nr:MAG: hypothetical protein DWI55_08150 [Chloroflexota bacterium]
MPLSSHTHPAYELDLHTRPHFLTKLLRACKINPYVFVYFITILWCGKEFSVIFVAVLLILMMYFDI